MAKFEEAHKRMFNKTFVCRKCKTKRKAPNIKVIEGKITCRRCGSKDFKTKRKK
jgi:ribosomal protein L40E